MRRWAAIVLLLASITVLLFLVFTTQVQAQQRCWPHAHVVKFLTERHGESAILRGLTIGGNQRIFELFLNPTKRTWTVVLTDQAGNACLQGSGTDLEMITVISPPDGDPS
jgi:hypothetical protein|tara:strand:- start:1431 stop:1760 length:330 start_codon:yes stop_codon:yes gene_type:complete